MTKDLPKNWSQTKQRISGHKIKLPSFFSRQNVTISKKIQKNIKTFQFPSILLQTVCKKFFFQIQNVERCNLMRITKFCIIVYKKVEGWHYLLKFTVYRVLEFIKKLKLTASDKSINK